MARQITVAVPVPFLPVLTYGVPDGIGTPAVGTRVVVPLAHRTVIGCVVGRDTPSNNVSNGPRESVSVEDSQVRELVEVLDEEPYLPPDVLELAYWVAEYFACSCGEAIAAAMPPLAMSDRGKSRASVFKYEKVVHLSDLGRDACLGTPPSDLGQRQRLTLRRLQQASGGVPLSILRSEGIGTDSVSRLSRRGLVSVRSVQVERDPLGPEAVTQSALIDADAERELTIQQKQAINELIKLSEGNSFQVALLHGVTGSGKTEVYLRLAQHMGTLGRSVLMLVPEIALTKFY